MGFSARATPKGCRSPQAPPALHATALLLNSTEREKASLVHESIVLIGPQGFQPDGRNGNTNHDQHDT